MLVGRISFSRTRPAPDPSHQTRISVTIFPADSGTLSSQALSRQPLALTTDSQGVFRIPLDGLGSGPFNLLVKPAHALPLVLLGVAPHAPAGPGGLSGASTGVHDLGAAVEGDVNGDGVIDEHDLERLRQAFAKKHGQPGWLEDADLNQDGEVTLLDFSILSAALRTPPGQAKKTPSPTPAPSATRTPTSSATVSPSATNTATLTASSTPTPTATPVGQVSQVIGTDGGLLESGDGVVVAFPANAIPTSVVVTYTRGSRTPIELSPTQRVLRTFELTAADVSGASVTQFAAPLMLEVEPGPGTAPDDALARIRLAYLDPTTGQWIELPSQSVLSNPLRIRAQTDHFTVFGALETFDCFPCAANDKVIFTDDFNYGVGWPALGSSTGAWVNRNTVAINAPILDNNPNARYIRIQTGSMMTLENGTNLGKDITYRAAFASTNENDSYGGLVFGYQGTPGGGVPNYFAIVKNQKGGGGGNDPPLVLLECTAVPCGTPAWTGAAETLASITCAAGCIPRAAGFGYDPNVNSWWWIEVNISSASPAVFTIRSYPDVGTGCGGGVDPCRPNTGSVADNFTYTDTPGTYSYGAVGFSAVGTDWDIAAPVIRTNLPSASGQFSTCMHRAEPIYGSPSGCTGEPVVIYDNVTAAPSGTGSIQLVAGETTDIGWAYENKNTLAAGNYGMRALIKPNLAGGWGRARLINAGTLAVIAEAGPDIATSASHECVATVPAGWYDCQVSFTLGAATNVDLRLQVSGGSGTVNFDNVTVSAIPNQIPVVYTFGATNNKAAFSVNDDRDAAAGVQIYAGQSPASPCGAACATYSVRLYDTVAGVTTLIGSYTNAQWEAALNLHTPTVNVLHTYTAVYLDASGIRGVASSSAAPAFVIDQTPPTIFVASTLPAANGNGWNNSAVTVTFTCNDPNTGSNTGIATAGCAASAPIGSGVAGGPVGGGVNVNGTWTLSTETSGTVVTGTATDVAGNTATTSSASIRIDLTAPTVTVAVAGTVGNAGWYIGPVTVTVTCTDALSGMATNSCVPTGGTTNTSGTGSGTAAITADTTGTTVTGTATDNASNVRTANTTIKVDTTRPTSRSTRVGVNTPALGNGNSFNASTLSQLTNVTGDTNDATSGIDTVTVTLRRASDGFYWNPAGNVWQAGAATISTTLSAGSIPGTRTWTTTGSWPSGLTSTTGWIEDTYSVYTSAQDKAGFVENAPGGVAANDSNFIQFSVDATPPANASVVICKTGPCGATSDQFTNTAANTLHLHATDGNTVFAYKVGESTASAAAALTVASATAQVGIAPVATYDDTNVAFTLSAVQGLHYVAALYRDTAGNWCCDAVGTMVTTSIILDTVVPSISIITPAAGTVYGATSVGIQINISDATSGFSTAPSVTVDQSPAGGPVNATFVSCAPALPQPVNPPGATGTIACTYTYVVTASPATDGTATITATVSDRATNSATASTAITIDTQPPTVAVTSAVKSPSMVAYAANTWSNQTVVVTFTCSDGGTGIASLATPGCAGSGTSGSGVNGGPGGGGQNVTATWTVSAETAPAGVTATGVAIDKAGNMATTSFGPILIDLTPPTISATAPPPADGLNGWHVTNLLVSFTCADPNGASSGAAGSGMASPSGCQPTSVGPTNSAGVTTGTSLITTEGVGTLTGTATDAAGNTSSITVPPGFYKLDKTRPTSEITLIGNAADVPGLAFNAANYTNLTTSGIQGLATDTVSGIADLTDTNAAQAVRLRLSRNNAGATRYWDPGSMTWVAAITDIYVTATQTVPTSTWTWTLPTGKMPLGTTSAVNGWPEDNYTITSLSQDEAGWLQLTPSTSTFSVDATAPTGALTVNCLPLAGGANCVGGTKYVNTTTVPLTVTASDGVALASYVLAQSGVGGTNLNAQASATALQNTGSEVPLGSVTTYTNAGVTFPLVPTTDGLYWIAAEYEDTAGNWCCAAPAAPVADSVVLDRVAPAVAILAPAAGTVFGDVMVIIQVQISDATSGIGIAPTVTVDQAGGGAAIVATPTGCAPALPTNGPVVCSYSYDVVSSVTEDGTALISVSAADQALNLATTSSTFIVDTQPPTISVLTAVETPSGTPYIAGGWANESVLVTFSCSDGGTGIAAAGCSSTSTNGSSAGSGGPAAGGVSVTAAWTVTAQTSAAGVYVTGTAVDKAGNLATTTYGPVRIDLTAPTVVLGVSGTVGNAGWYVSTVTVTATCTDGLSGMPTATNSCTIAGGTTNSPGTGTAIATFTADSASAGTVVTGTATDVAGNAASATTTVRVDLTKPVSNIMRVGTNTTPLPNNGNSFNATTLAQLTVVTGTATDAASGIETVTITLRRASDGFYWNPAGPGAWGAAPAVIATTFIGGTVPGTRIWQTTGSWPSGITSATGWIEDTYQVYSSSQDQAGLVEAAPGASPANNSNYVEFSVDATPPSNASIVVCKSGPCGITSDLFTNNVNVALHLHAEDGKQVAAYKRAESTTSAVTALGLASATAEVAVVPTTTYDNTNVTGAANGIVLSAIEGVHHLVALFRDVAGNWCCDSAGTVVGTSIVLDTTPPTVTVVSPVPTDVIGATTITIEITIEDALSGFGAAPTVTVDQFPTGGPVGATFVNCGALFPIGAPTGSVSCFYTYSVVASSSTDGVATITAVASDRAGNLRTGTGSFIVDTQPPTITAAAATTPGAAVYLASTWTNKDVVVTFTCRDLGTGIVASGCRSTSTSGSGVDGGPAPLNTNAFGTWTISAQTAMTGVFVTGTAEDLAGNLATTTFGPVLIDKTLPVITVSSISPPAPDGNNGWYVSPITVEIACADALSGMAANTCFVTGGGTATPGTVTGTTVVSTDTSVTSLTGTATDIAGNVVTMTIPPGAYKVDVTRPVSKVLAIGALAGIGDPAHGASFNATTVVSATSIQGEATDATSGVAEVRVFLQRADTSQYWDPGASGWSLTPVTITAVIASSVTGTWTWQTSQVPTAGAWPETAFYVYTQAVDDAGNTELLGTSAGANTDTKVIRFSVDATAPSNATVCAFRTGACTGSTSQVYVNNTQVFLHLVAQDLNLINAYSIGVSTVDAATAVTNATGAQPANATINLTPATSTHDSTSRTANLLSGDGLYYIAAQFRDNAANWCCANLGAPNQNQTAATTSLTLDTTPPSITITSVTPNPALASATVTIVVSLRDVTSGLAVGPTVTVRQANGGPTIVATQIGACAPGANPWVNVVITCTYEYSVINYTAGTPYDGTAVVRAQATDQAGNSADLTATFTVETSPPTISFTIRTVPDNLPYVSGTWTRHDVLATYSCSDIGSGLKPAGVGCVGFAAPPSGTATAGATFYRFQFNVETSAAGASISGRAEDNAGNFTLSSPVTFTPILIDRTPPSTTISSPTTAGGPYPGPTFPSLSGTATDPLSGVQAVHVSIKKAGTSQYWSGSAWQFGATYLLTTGTAAWSLSSSLPANANLPEGLYEVCARGTDVAGNVQLVLTCETVSINQAPYITSFEPASGAVVSRLLNQIVIRFSEDVFDSAGGTLDGTAGDYGLGAEISVIDVTGGGTLLAAASASCSSPCRAYTITLPTATVLGVGNQYEIRVQGGASGIRDNATGTLGNSVGNPVALVTATFHTANPASVPFGNTTSWSGATPPTIATMTPARRDVAAASVGGLFYVMGGVDGAGVIQSSNQMYNPATNAWTFRRAMTAPRTGHTAVTVGSSIYVIGGANSTGTLSSVQIYNPGANTWGAGPSLPAARKYAAAAYDPGTNAIYVMGGSSSTGSQVKSVYKLTIGSSTWQDLTSTDPMPAFRNQFTLTAVQTTSGYRLVAVGGTLSTSATSSDVFNPAAGAGARWSAGPGLAAQKSYHGAAVLNDYLYVIGGMDVAGTPQSTIYYYDPLLGGGWQPVTTVGSFTEGRAAFGGQVAVLNSTTTPGVSGIMIAGGRTTSLPVTSEVLAGQHP